MSNFFEDLGKNIGVGIGNAVGSAIVEVGKGIVETANEALKDKTPLPAPPKMEDLNNNKEEK